MREIQTLINMVGLQYTVQLIGDDDDDVKVTDRKAWGEVLNPALNFLRAQGGGQMLVIHTPEDQARFLD